MPSHCRRMRACDEAPCNGEMHVHACIGFYQACAANPAHFSCVQHAWTHRNQLYCGMYEALRGCEAPWYIASSKAPQRVRPLLCSLLGVRLEPGSPRLLAGLIPPTERKIEALR